MSDHNRTPEQRARTTIDTKLEEAGWRVQSMRQIDFSAGAGIAVREYQTDVGPADYVLFVERKPVGVIEAKPENWGQKITAVEEQSTGYADATLKWLNSAEPRPFVYESTGALTRFTDRRDPKPRSREVFSFHRPDTMQEWLAQPGSLRARLQGLPDLDPTGLRGCQITAVERLEASFKLNHPRALMQMATGSGKTYTAITAVYRLLKHADAKRILVLLLLGKRLVDKPAVVGVRRRRAGARSTGSPARGAAGELCFDAEPSPALKAGFSNDDFHVPPQCGQQAQEALHRILAKASAQEPRNVRLRQSQDLRGIGLLKAAFANDLVDASDKLCLQ